jgi:hypothetical protein
VELKISIGATVVTVDGLELGQVKKVEESAFLVDAPRQFDYWLQTTLAVAATDERVELTITQADLGAYKMDNPNDHNEFRANVPQNLQPETIRGSTLHR